GHSEGGLFAMQIGSDYSNTGRQPWKIVLMSAAGRKIGLIVHEQLAFRLKQSLASPEITQKFLGWWDAAAVALENNKPLPPDQPTELKEIVNPTVMDL